jgi:hypothetical protein
MDFTSFLSGRFGIVFLGWIADQALRTDLLSFLMYPKSTDVQVLLLPSLRDLLIKTCAVVAQTGLRSHSTELSVLIINYGVT